MLPKKMLGWGRQRSVIREVFEEGKVMKQKYGVDNVFDFSLGNPSIPSPKSVNDTLIYLLKEKDNVYLHGYTSGPGDTEVRFTIAEYLNRTYGVNESFERIYMTCGAAASLAITLHAILSPGDEVILIAPYFAEYTVFVECAGGIVRVADSDENAQIDISTLEKAINKKTKAIIINSPNNPSGAVYSEESLIQLSKLLKKKEQELSSHIYIVSDEPYRELVYDGETVPYIAKYYDNTISCYSFSKALSLPGERIGYICVCEKCFGGDNIFASIQGAGRALGYVCAPSLFQKLIPYVIGQTSDISLYDENRKLIYEIVKEAGFDAIYPKGAFYLFIKSPFEDSKDFCDLAKKYNILLVRGDGFGKKSYARASYCVSNEMIKKSRENWMLLGKECFNGK